MDHVCASIDAPVLHGATQGLVHGFRSAAAQSESSSGVGAQTYLCLARFTDVVVGGSVTVFVCGAAVISRVAWLVITVQ